MGLNLVHQLTQRGLQVLALSRWPPELLSGPVQRAEWILGDVTRRQELIELVRCRAVTRIVHTAAVTPTPDVERTDPARIVDINLGGTLNALEAARLGHVRRFLFVSSSVLYRDFPLACGPAREDDALPPTNLYGICKDACERLCRQYHALCGLSAVSVRLGTAYGPWERPSQSRTRLSAIAQLVAWGLGPRDHPLRVYGSHIKRDYIYVEDACAAMADLVLHPQPRWGLYNLSSDVSYPLVDVLQALQAVIPGFRWQPTADPEAAEFGFVAIDARTPLDLSRLRTDLPHLQFRDLDTGITDYMAWIREARD